MTTPDLVSPSGGGSLLALRVQKRLLDGLTLVILLAVSLAVAVPWFLQALPVDLTLAGRSAFAYVLMYLGAAALADRLRHRWSLLAALILLETSVVVFLGILWHLAGGLQNPMLLLAYFLLVMASGVALGRWHAAFVAILSIAVVGIVALVESPELPSYLLGAGIPVARLVRSLPAVTVPLRFPGLATPAAYLFVALAVFAVLLLGGVVLSGSLARRLRSLDSVRGLVLDDARVTEALFRTAFRTAPTPTVLVLAEDGLVAAASDGFATRMLRHGEELVGRKLFELIRFAEPHRVRELLGVGQGELPLCAYHVGPEARVAQVRVYPFRSEGVSYRSVSFEDRTDLADLHAALQQTDEAVLVIGADDRLRYANRAAGRLFGELYPGMEAGALESSGLPPRWWSSGEHPAVERRVVIDRASYQVRITAAVGPDEGGTFRLVRLSRETTEPTS